ncbi:SMI1/KNR4 family protein [uncultured Maritimibacter sp.]|jgi:hypothetical protein|uniref:SMI1/KNR4 family protein n=1 Tax=uncultured Maritimibacter sp. TaxID=991866 RepID=UPI002606A29D|nr:SMI1/KNR4 family protein [uncultured Maritimibacter sp.]
MPDNTLTKEFRLMSALALMSRTTVMPLRIALTVVLLGYPAWLGFNGRAVWLIPAIGLVFAVSYVMGKWKRLDAPRLFSGGVAAGIAFPVQIIFVGVLYLIGRGIGSLMGREGLTPMTETDVIVFVYWGVAMVVAGALLIRLERSRPTVEDEIARMFPDLPRPVQPEGTAPAHRLTVETLYSDPHYSHYDNLYDEDKETTLNPEKAYLDDAQLAAIEARFGVRFPETLRALYLKQNGGSVRDVFVGDPTHPDEDDLAPFSGYSDLIPATELRTLGASIDDVAYREHEPERFPDGCDDLIILAQWYAKTLFLDTRTTPMRVGFLDFDGVEKGDDWEGRATWWPDFDAFLASLYRYEF